MDYERCKYCGAPAARNKQGIWGIACGGCKGALTRMLRNKNRAWTKERLQRAKYDWNKKKWIVPEE